MRQAGDRLSGTAVRTRTYLHRGFYTWKLAPEKINPSEGGADRTDFRWVPAERQHTLLHQEMRIG
jgi:hypothetical protein